MSSRCDVFFYEAFEEEAAALRACLPDDLRVGFTAATVQETGHEAPPAPVVSTRTQSVLPVGWAAALQGILTRSTGYDHMVRYRASAAGAAPLCGYLPLYCNRAVAEQAMLLWMALLRRLPPQVSQFGSFHRDGLTGRECRGKHLAVFGVGNIGSEVVDIGRGLGMEVVGVDPVRRLEGLAYVTPEEAVSWADILVCAMNLTASNEGYFDQERLRDLRSGAVFVNVARGELAVAEDVESLLREGRLGGVGLDVYADEPALAVALRRGDGADESLPASVRAVLRLARRPEVICTPHNAFNTVESVQRKAEQSVQQLLHLRDTGSFLWPVPA